MCFGRLRANRCGYVPPLLEHDPVSYENGKPFFAGGYM